ncbi:MAG: DUF4440 domain-containing protein [Hyphomicrobiales bacterium]|nr:DUF4440 domain-containing protein [Hyphomicrobiales bacterium]
MLRRATITAFMALWPAFAMAQTTGTPDDHDALRALKEKAVAVVNNRDYATARAILHDPFMATVITQDAFTDFNDVKSFFEGLYTRDFLRMKEIHFSAEADDYSTVYTGTFALTKGSTLERYELADGRSFDMKGRWTAVSIKDGNEWKIAAIHMGTNFLDNPVLNAIEKSVMWTGAGGAAGGLLIGLAGGWVIGRRRRPASA